LIAPAPLTSSTSGQSSPRPSPSRSPAFAATVRNAV
jgi:hypothetical protein